MILQCDRLELQAPGLKPQSEGRWLLSGVDEPGEREHRASGGRCSTKHCPLGWWGGRENESTKAEVSFRCVTALGILSEKSASTSRALKYCYPSWLMHEL